MAIQRCILYLWLIAFLLQTFVRARSINLRSIEKLENELERDLDHAIQRLQEVRHVRETLEHSRQDAALESEDSDFEQSNVRTRRNHPRNIAVQCRLWYHQHRELPPMCQRLYKNPNVIDM